MDFHEIGKEIRKARKNLRMNQSDLSSKCGMSRATISGIENGTITEIGIRKVIAICNMLGLEFLVQERSPYPTLQQLIKEQNNA